MVWLKGAQKENREEFDDIDHWIHMLIEEKSNAINYLYFRCNKQIFHIARLNKLSYEDSEELICDCIVLFIQKLKTGEFKYQGTDPISYLIEIAKYKAKNYFRRAQKHTASELPESDELPNYEDRDKAEVVVELDKLLEKLDANCKKLITLKYLEEMKDADIIEQGLTQYSTVNALKSHRSKCMKKLTELYSSIKLHK